MEYGFNAMLTYALSAYNSGSSFDGIVKDYQNSGATGKKKDRRVPRTKGKRDRSLKIRSRRRK